MSTILERYEKLHPKSMELYARALKTFPSGITHDVRYFRPFPIYVDHAQGSKKWDVDGHEIVDYVMGHGALLLGHSRPEVVTAVQQQVAKGTHYGASHELEIRWGNLVQQLIPSAQVVKFTSSGTEATMMALRLARAFTGRDKIIKFDNHFHGWNDNLIGIRRIGDEMLGAAGVPRATLSNIVIIPQNDPDLLERTLQANPDVAAVVLEPTGASWGTLPLPPEFLHDLRAITERHGVVLIFDEVITGFRLSSGGAQKLYNVTPDITTMAKILAGGLPGGAVAGRAEIIAMLEMRDDKWNQWQRMSHPGTFNANPLSAAAGLAGLSIVAKGEVHSHAGSIAAKLRRGINEILDRKRLEGCAYSTSSMFHIIIGRECERRGDCDRTLCTLAPEKLKPSMRPEVSAALVQELLNRGVHLFGTGGFTSAAHTDADAELTLNAIDEATSEMQKEGLFQGRD